MQAMGDRWASRLEQAWAAGRRSQQALILSALTGLLTGGATTANIGEVRVEIYRVFPALSDVGRTSGPPTFSTPQVPTRVNSPSDVELDDRDTSPAPGNLTFTTKDLGASAAANSVWVAASAADVWSNASRWRA